MGAGSERIPPISEGLPAASDNRIACSEMPTRETLTRFLSPLLCGPATPESGLLVIHRQRLTQGTAPKEVVTCRLWDGTELRVLCKYSDEERVPKPEHRRGVAYEAVVYRDVLPYTCGRTPDFYGLVEHGNADADCLVLEYVEGGVRVSVSDDQRAMPLAARWSGRFHAASEALGVHPHTGVTVYNRDDYLKWSDRARRFLEARSECPRWVGHACEKYADLVAELLAPPLTLVHGEFYPKNLLIRGGVVCPVDWESTAIAAGEIDLACLTEFWKDGVVRACEAEYVRARWPGGVPANFARRLDVARLYWNFRWLGDSPGFLSGGALLRQLEELRAVAVRLGTIE